jgi:GAF domain-containing protein
VRAQREGVLIPDTSADPRWYQPEQRWLASPKSVISVPLIGRERVVGVLTVGRLPTGAFVPDDLALLNAIAAQAGVAVENAQLFALERRAHVVGQTLHEVARTINGSLDLSQVLTLILEQLGRVIVCDSGSILLRQGQRLSLVASRGFADPEAVTRVAFGLERGLSARVVRERRSLVVDDVQRSDEWLPTPVPESDTIRAWIGAPLIAQEEVIGLLSVDNREPGAYDEADGQVSRQWVFKGSEIDDEAVGELTQWQKDGKISDKVWVTPKLPFLIPITLGFLAGVFYGDILMLVISTLMGR